MFSDIKMIGAPGKRILWHPRGENQALIEIGSQIILHAWSPEESAIAQLRSQHNLNPMKA
jgi:hypothetical protein